jgi:AcrR family transcriptional regulator
MADLRTRRREQTRREVGEVALRLFVERGYSNVTVSEVAEAADISQRTFFNHFSGKEDAALAASADDLSVLAEALRDRGTDDTFLDVFRSHARHRAQHFQPASEKQRLWRAFEQAHPDIAAKGNAQRAAAEQQLIIPEIARDLACEETDPRVLLIAGAFVGAGNVLNDLLEDPETRNHEELMHLGLDILGAALTHARLMTT